MADAIPVHHTVLKPTAEATKAKPEAKPANPLKTPEGLPVECEFGTLLTSHQAYRKDN